MKDPKYYTSLYNHKPISDGTKPLIGNLEFQQILSEVKAGNKDAYYNSLNSYCYEPKQQKIITDIINGNIL